MISIVARLSPSNPYAVFVLGTVAGVVVGVAYYWLIERRLIRKTWRNPFRNDTKANTNI